MDRRFTTSALALAGVLLVIGWYVSTPSADGFDAASPASISREGAPNGGPFGATGGASSVFARASGASQSPFGAVQSLPDPQGSRQQFEKLVRDYRLGELDPQDKTRIKEALFDLKQDPVARAFIIEAFFSHDNPQLAESLYGLMRDADLKDVTMLEGLIQRESTRPTTNSKARIVDLIADLSTKKDVPYSTAIDGYLAQVAQNGDPALRTTAASQRMWYLAQHQPHNLAALEQNLLDTAPAVREEAYSLIESRLASQTPAAQAKLAPALKAALQAEHLGASQEEKARVSALLAALTGSGAETP